MARKEAPRPKPVQLILGEDSYLAEQALERVLQLAVGEDRSDAVSVFYGDECRWDAVLAAACTGSLFASRRAIVVRRAEALRSSGSEEEAPAEGLKGRSRSAADPVLQFLEDPPPDVTLVLLATKPDRRRNPWKRLSAEGELHSAEPKKGSALRAYVEEHLRGRGLRLTPDAVADLIVEVGQDLRRLIGELDKLEAWGVGRQDPLTAEDVHTVLGRGLGRPLYLLADATARRDLPASLEQLLEAGQAAAQVAPGEGVRQQVERPPQAASQHRVDVGRAQRLPALAAPGLQLVQLPHQPPEVLAHFVDEVL